ncbi:MAG: hypothetical protein RLN62_05505 [Rickettsiales bacterium]
MIQMQYFGHTFSFDTAPMVEVAQAELRREMGGDEGEVGGEGEGEGEGGGGEGEGASMSVSCFGCFGGEVTPSMAPSGDLMSVTEES